MLNKLLRSIVDQDRAPVVVCDVNSLIVYMNPSAIEEYHKNLTGLDLKVCHNEESNKKIEKVIEWFRQSKNNNIVFTYYDEKKNKDVYMVALRDEDENLIGYYEKHEFRNRETANVYADIKQR